MYIRIRKLLSGMIILFLVFSIGCAKKYAVLISTNKVIMDNNSYHSEWWYDLFLEYGALRDNGFADKNIYVLYGDGNDFDTSYASYNATTQYGHTITDMAVNKANVQSIFNTLNGKVTHKDHLYCWWMGHGSGLGANYCDLSMHISNTGEIVTDTEFSSYINNVANYKKRTVSVMTCHAGGMIDNMDVAGNQTVTLTSSTCAESSYDALYTCNGRYHADFNYTFPSALRQSDPCGTPVGSDYDTNGEVSLSEAHQYNLATMTTSTSQLGDPDAITQNTYLSRQNP
jgi:hypothetical protein